MRRFAQKRRKEQLRQSTIGFLFVLPAVVGFLIFIYRPLIDTFILSFQKWNMISPTREFVGLQNYQEVFSSEAFYQSLQNTGFYALWLIILIIALPLVLSYGLTKVGKKSSNIYRIVMFAPTIVSLGIASVIFVWIFNPIGGLVASISELFGKTPLNWMSSIERARIPILVVVAWKSMGYNMVLISAAIGSVPSEIKEAAELDGAVGGKLWRHVILPLIAPTIVFVFIMTMSMAAEYVFTPIHVMTGGGPQGVTTNIVFEIYRQAFLWFRIGMSSTYAIIVFVVFGLLLAIQGFITRKVVSYEER